MKKFILLLLSLQCCLCSMSLAQNPGDLDNSFSTDGTVRMTYSPWLDVAVQSDGKVLVVGYLIARYNVDGTLDGTFGINGTDSIKINDTLYKCNAICIQQDGKILIAGGTDGNMGINDFLLLRYNSDGSPDSSFDGNGVVTTDINSGFDDHGYELAIQPDGKIIVAGSSSANLALSRYNPNGSLDNTFDGDGKLVVNSVTVDFSNNQSHPTYMKLQADGKIVVGSSNALVRLNSDGSIDNSFGINGVVGLPQPMNDLAIQSDGKSILAGRSGLAFAIVRLNINGNFDNTFGNAGIVTTGSSLFGCSNKSQRATSIALQPDGRILAGGYDICGQMFNWRDFVLARYNQNGGLDSSFGSDGQVITSFTGPFDEMESYSSVITPDLKIVLAGYSSGQFSADVNGALARYYLGPMEWPFDVNTVSGSGANFVISPNPTSDYVNIEASEIDNGIWHLELRDVTGRQIMREDIVATGGSIKKNVSLNELPAGLYLLQLDNGKQKTVAKVVKSR